MSDATPMLTPLGFPGAPVLPWPAGAAAPVLPAGAAGIAVRVRKRWSDPPNWETPRTVGVDDRPMWAGIGRMIVVTDPGEHLVEVRSSLEADTVRLVQVKDGEIAELDYWIPASYGGAQGVLVPAPAPAWRRLGSGLTAMLMPLIGLSAVTLLVSKTGIRPDGFVFVAIMLAAVGFTVAWVKGKGYADRRYRAAVSDEATRPGHSADTGMFLGDGAPPQGLADSGHGVLVVTGALVRRYRWNNHRDPAKAAADPNGWVPWPALAVDGTARPFSWRTWCYRLPAGSHEVTVRAAGHAESVTRTVTINPGQITRLDVRADTTVEVRSPSLDRTVPTEVVGVTAEVKL